MNRNINDSLIDIDEDIDHLENCPYRGILCVICSISIVWLLYLLFFIQLLHETINNSNSTDYD